MAGTSMAEQSNGTPPLNPNRLLPSPIPPRPTSSSLCSQRPQSGISAVSSNNGRYRDDQLDGATVRKSHSHSVSSNPQTLASSKGSLSAVSNDNKDKQRAVRTLPRKRPNTLQATGAIHKLILYSMGPICRRRRQCRPFEPPPP